jgi:hypothetical protein
MIRLLTDWAGSGMPALPPPGTTSPTPAGGTTI